MNWRFWNRRYYLASIYVTMVAIVLMTYWKSFDRGTTFSIMPLLWPFIIGFALAYLLNFLLVFYEKKVKKRFFSLLAVYGTVVAIFSAFLFFLAPQVAEAMDHFIEEFPDYSEQIITQMEGHLARFDVTADHVDTISETLEVSISQFVNFNQNLVPLLMRHLVTIGETVKNIVLGMVLSVYLLASKERLLRQAGKLGLAVIGKEKWRMVRRWLRRGHEIFTRFFTGMLLNSFIVGVMTVGLLFLFQIPFAVLVGFLVALTNMIPIFGPFIGAVPSAIMIFFISPTKALVFVVIILVIQQLDANIITPKILGDKIGISAIWVLVSILVFGHFFGILGMILGVPITALILEMLEEVVNKKIVEKRYNK